MAGALPAIPERWEALPGLPCVDRGAGDGHVRRDLLQQQAPLGAQQCEAEFEDTEFGSLGREAVYYARVIQEPTDTIHGDPFGCDYDEQGNCVKTNYCLGVAKDEDCLSPAAHRAWSSPIFVQFAGE